MGTWRRWSMTVGELLSTARRLEGDARAAAGLPRSAGRPVRPSG